PGSLPLLDLHSFPTRRSSDLVIRQHAGPGERIGVPFGTNGPQYAITGCPTVVFGPGSIDQAHTCDEWLDVEQLRTAADTLSDFVDRKSTRLNSSHVAISYAVF